MLRFLGIAMILGAAACKPPGNDPLSPENQSLLLLKAVGSARVEADKNRDITLNMVATIQGVGPAAGLPVTVAFANTAKGDLQAGTFMTDDAGFLAIPYHTPDEDNATVMITCKTDGAPTLTFTVYVARDTLKLDWDGHKPRLVKKETDEELVIVATNQRGAPVADVEVTALIVGGSSYGAAFVGEAKEWTDASGNAVFHFTSGTALTTYTVRAQAERTGDANLEVVVVEQLPSTLHCDFSSDCGAGEICVEGACVTGSRRCRNTHPEDCPSGYTCENNICVGGCAGTTCMAPPGGDLDVTGRWYTSYNFTFKEALGMLNGLGAPLADLDTVLQGKIPGKDIPVWGPILEIMLTALIKAYVPDWTPKLASALNDLWAALDNVVIGGRMELRPQVAGSNVLLGEETWDTFQVMIPSLCERRQNDPQWPRCAKVNLQLGKDIGGGITGKATALPFVGVIQGKTVTFTGRQATMEMQKLISNLVDLIGNIATNGRAKTIEDAVPLIIDCVSLKSAADSLACDVSNGSTCELKWFVPVCQTMTKGLGLILGAVLENVPLDWTLSNFSETCQARDTSKPANVRADLLEGGQVIGTSNLGSGAPMTGIFSATR
jgi:hypothetical protein